MDKIDIILWIIGGGFALMLIMWQNLMSKLDKIETKIDDVDKNLQGVITKVAVAENNIADIKINVGYLMWHEQPKDIKEK